MSGALEPDYDSDPERFRTDLSPFQLQGDVSSLTSRSRAGMRRCREGDVPLTVTKRGVLIYCRKER